MCGPVDNLVAVAVNDHVIRWCGKFQRLRKKYLVERAGLVAPYVRMAFQPPTSPADNSAYGVYKIIYEPDYSATGQWHPKQIPALP